MVLNSIIAAGLGLALAAFYANKVLSIEVTDKKVEELSSSIAFIKKKCIRGRINININVTEHDEDSNLDLNLSKLNAYMKILKSISKSKYLN